MSNPTQIVRRTTVVVGAVYALALHTADVQLDTSLKKVLAYLPSAAAFVVAAFDKWIWAWPGVSRLHARPQLRGTWRVELRPDPESHIPEGGNQGPIDGYAVIEQTFWSVSVRQYTAESDSESRAMTWLTNVDASPVVLNFTYDNVPKREHRPRSPRHVGACELRMPRGKPTSVTGTYFTDRFTAGEMTLTLVGRSTDVMTFEEAEQRHGVAQAISPAHDWLKRLGIGRAE
ncbi:MAG: hypothetical protein QOE05_469 [Actinomycetota bacterium]|jgi:hypothetical protein|nr:hypothetical protein [Actinomycetota bacterium]